jgi:hypothetical protein
VAYNYNTKNDSCGHTLSVLLQFLLKQIADPSVLVCTTLVDMDSINSQRFLFAFYYFILGVIAISRVKDAPVVHSW